MKEIISIHIFCPLLLHKQNLLFVMNDDNYFTNRCRETTLAYGPEFTLCSTGVIAMSDFCHTLSNNICLCVS